MISTFEYTSVLHQRTDITDTLSIFQVKSSEPLSPFKAGQFIMVGLKPNAPRVAEAEPEIIKRKPTDPIIRRAYSICSDPTQTQYYEIYLSLVKAGELTSRLFCLKPGDRLWMSTKPAGVFTLESVPPHKGLLMFSTGTGIAPFLSMIRQAKREKNRRKMMLIHAIDVSTQLGYRTEFEAFQKENSNFKYLPIVTFPDREPTWRGLTGWIQDDLRNGTYEKQTGWTFTPQHFHALLCGNPTMIQSGIQALSEKGFKLGKSKNPAATIYIEEYW